MGRRRMYADDAARKRASRARQPGSSHQAAPEPTRPAARAEQNIVTHPHGKNTHGHDIKGLVAPVRASHGLSGGVYQHTAAAGLLVRVDGELAGGRVLATVLVPGQSNLTAGTAYPFRVDLLNEVSP